VLSLPHPELTCLVDNHTSLGENEVPAAVQDTVSQPSGQHDLPQSAQSKVKALQHNELSGYAEVTHPFHPLKNQRFLILKTRKIAGCQTLTLKGGLTGTFAVPLEWTDRHKAFDPDFHQQEQTILDYQSLVTLINFLNSLEYQNK